MKKNDLIKLLQAIEGNPDLLLWNGTIGDWQDIDSKFVEGALVKMTLKYYLDTCQLEEQIDKWDWTYKMPEEEIERLTKKYRSICKWEDNNWVSSEDIKKKKYTRKDVLYLQPKRRGETSYGRGCNVEY